MENIDFTIPIGGIIPARRLVVTTRKNYCKMLETKLSNQLNRKVHNLKQLHKKKKKIQRLIASLSIEIVSKEIRKKGLEMILENYDNWVREEVSLAVDNLLQRCTRK